LNGDIAFVWAARGSRARALRPDHASVPAAFAAARPWLGAVAAVFLAFFFVVIGAVNLDVGPAEARLGLAAGNRAAPLGQVFGYWAPDVWPAEFLPTLILGRMELGGRPSSAAVRWPAAIAGICVGWLFAWRLARKQGVRAGVLFCVCWFSSLGLIDRSAWTGMDLILGLSAMAALDRIFSRGADWVAGLWLALAFLAGGWPPLVLVGLAVVAGGKKGLRLSLWSLIPPLLAIGVWSFATIRSSSAEVWAAALMLPVTAKQVWSLGPTILAAGLPWSPLAILVAGRSVREHWRPEARAWLKCWLQVGAVALLAGTLVPGLSATAATVLLASLSIAAAAGVDAAWAASLSRPVRGAFFTVFSIVVAVWLVLSLYGSFLWSVSMPFYRTLGVGMAVMALVVGALGWWALETGNSRRALAPLMLVAIGLKLVHWGYYQPEWNYRHSQGPWARAISQWIPRKWTLYTTHTWPADLAFFMKRPVRQLAGPDHLRYERGPTSKFVLLLPSEFDNWPASAPPISAVVRLLDQRGAERIVARTAGPLPPPFGPGTPRIAAVPAVAPR
jgi:hypothetical protein